MQLMLGLSVTFTFFVVQIQAQPYKRRRDNILATSCALCMCSFFFGALLYRFHELTSEFDTVSSQLTSNWASKRFTFSFEFISVLMIVGVFGKLAVLIGLECLELLRPSNNQVLRLLYLETREEVPAPPEFMQNARLLEKMINGYLYQKDLSGNVIAAAAPLPTAGPFHCFLSHSKHK